MVTRVRKKDVNFVERAPRASVDRPDPLPRDDLLVAAGTGA